MGGGVLIGSPSRLQAVASYRIQSNYACLGRTAKFVSKIKIKKIKGVRHNGGSVMTSTNAVEAPMSVKLKGNRV